MNKIDVIIPTIMNVRPELFGYLLIQLYECPVVNKVIVIDNTADQSFKTTMHILASNHFTDKLSIRNGYKYKFLVNKSWNVGLNFSIHSKKEAPYYLLLNDDIILTSNVLETCVNIMQSNSDISLLTVATMNDVPINSYLKEYDKGQNKLTNIIPNGRQGWFMLGRKNQWKPIPSELQLFYGDDFIYRKAREIGKVVMLENPMISHFQSSSVNNNMDKLKPIIEQDEKEWISLLKRGQI